MIKKINAFRRRFLSSLTKEIGKKQDFSFDSNDAKNCERILVSRPNHRLGNMLLITPLINELTTVFPYSRIDIFAKGPLARSIFENYPNVSIIELPKKHFRHLFQYIFAWIKLRTTKYDLVINAMPNSSSGRLSTRFAKGKNKFYGFAFNDVQYPLAEYRHIAKHPVYGLWNYLGLYKNEYIVPEMDLKLSFLELQKGNRLLAEMVDTHKKTICLFTYATGDKIYPSSWWNEFYKILKNRYKDYNIIEILPVERVSAFNFSIPHFYSKDIREIGSLIAGTDMFIGADSGMMHLANSVLNPTVGLFSVTDPNVYGCYGDGSISIDTNSNDVQDCVEIISNLLDNLETEYEATAIRYA
ncbi:glycosyltransferase family 9 protein [Flavobacterium sp.]|uniref:glycosyltransferase family 9 protein n=1 Tax=Flavobacterium sp. TaxID=239 RepID=UPI002B8C80D8|nr:glycosyltransferase family 9 protein [Flavobacterium sp.]HSD06899.1 glycosyltransferase family 9 protein [Flavobacterium sp.]